MVFKLTRSAEEKEDDDQDEIRPALDDDHDGDHQDKKAPDLPDDDQAQLRRDVM